MGLLDKKLISEMLVRDKQRKIKQRRRKAFKAQRKQIKKKHKNQRPKYAVYIVSPKWHRRCDAFYKKYGRFCAACGSKERLNVHHMTYRHTGSEHDDELAVLCKDCHAEFHQLNGTSLDMVEKTVAFIEEKQQLAMSTSWRWG